MKQILHWIKFLYQISVIRNVVWWSKIENVDFNNYYVYVVGITLNRMMTFKINSIVIQVLLQTCSSPDTFMYYYDYSIMTTQIFL